MEELHFSDVPSEDKAVYLATIIKSIHAMYVNEGTSKQNQKLNNCIEAILTSLDIADIDVDPRFIPDWLAE